MEEHEADREARIEAELGAARRVAQFVEQHFAQLKSLIETYSDEDAKRKLEILRDEFWSAS